jgi:hypothetical protein
MMFECNAEAIGFASDLLTTELFFTLTFDPLQGSHGFAGQRRHLVIFNNAL